MSIVESISESPKKINSEKSDNESPEKLIDNSEELSNPSPVSEKDIDIDEEVKDESKETLKDEEEISQNSLKSISSEVLKNEEDKSCYAEQQNEIKEAPEKSENLPKIDSCLDDASFTAGYMDDILQPMVEENSIKRAVPQHVQEILHAILCIESPDDLLVHRMSAQLQTINNEADFKLVIYQFIITIVSIWNIVVSF